MKQEEEVGLKMGATPHRVRATICEVISEFLSYSLP